MVRQMLFAVELLCSALIAHIHQLHYALGLLEKSGHRRSNDATAPSGEPDARI